MLLLALIGITLVKQSAVWQKKKSRTHTKFPFCLYKYFFMSWTLSLTPNVPVPSKNRGFTKEKAQALQAALNPAFCVWISAEKTQTLNLILNCVYSQ